MRVTYDHDRGDVWTLRSVWEKRRHSMHAEDRSGVWRYREALPFLDRVEDMVTLQEDLHTHSWRDYGMAAAMAQAKRLGVAAVFTAETGHHACTLREYAEAAVLPVVVGEADGDAWCIDSGNPFLLEGYRAFALQLLEEQDWQTPAVIRCGEQLPLWKAVFADLQAEGHCARELQLLAEEAEECFAERDGVLNA
jgi:hypothetical protein